MKQIIVYHPANSHINGGHTVFDGERLGFTAPQDGSLCIYHWTTDTEMGQAVFAKGEWAYICHSQPKD